MSDSKFRRLLSVSDQELRDIVIQLEAAARSDRAKRIAAKANRRAVPRLTYHIPDIALVVSHMGGYKSHLIVSSRNLCENGMGFIHGGYIHVGSSTHIALRRLDGELDSIRGTVRSCRHLTGMVHEIGVEFEYDIDPRLYIELQEDDDGSTEAIRIPQLPYRIVFGEASESDIALFEHYMMPTHAQVTIARTTGAVIDAARREDINIVFLELDIAGGDGIHAIRQLRWHKFANPIVVVTGEQRQDQIQAALESGANAILPKPFTGADLYKMVVDMLGIAETVEWTKCLRSTKASDPSIAHLIPQFIEQSKMVGSLLDQSCAVRDLRRTLELCEDLRDEAGRYGFKALQDAAALTLSALDDHGSIGPCTEQIQRLAVLCRCLSHAA